MKVISVRLALFIGIINVFEGSNYKKNIKTKYVLIIR